MQDALLAPRVGAARLGSAARRAPTAGPAGYYKLGGGGDGARERMGPAGVSRLGEGRRTTALRPASILSEEPRAD